MVDHSMSRGVREKTGYPSVVPYLLVVDGTGLIDFFERGFGAKRRFVMPTPENGIMHAEIEIGDGLLMLSDASDQPRHPAHLCLYVADVDAVYAQAISAGATSLTLPETKDYGDRVAGVKDPAGNTWWVCARVD